MEAEVELSLEIFPSQRERDRDRRGERAVPLSVLGGDLPEAGWLRARPQAAALVSLWCRGLVLPLGPLMWESLPFPSLFSVTLSCPCPPKCFICGRRPLSPLLGPCSRRRSLRAALRPAVQKPCSPRCPQQVGHAPKTTDHPHLP